MAGKGKWEKVGKDTQQTGKYREAVTQVYGNNRAAPGMAAARRVYTTKDRGKLKVNPGFYFWVHLSCREDSG